MCPPIYSQCQDGSQPVNGMCPASHCNPATDPNHCSNGQASGGGTCGAAPSCNGDPIACAALYQTWSTRCEVHKLNPDVLPSPGDYGVEHDASEIWESGDADPSTELDASGFGLGSGGGACPDMGSASFMGDAFNVADYVPCDSLRILAALILLAAYVQAAYIIGRQQ
jgi:hypothetical protein